MRKPAIALLCGLLAAAALALAWHLGGTHKEAKARPDPVAPLAAPAASTPAPAPAPEPIRPPERPAPPASASPVPRVAQQDIPFALSSDHRALVQDAAIASSDLQRLQQEPRDNDWAPEAERLIRNALAQHDSFAGFDLIAVDCRSTLCAIQAFSYGEEGNRQWVKALDDLYRQSLVDTFDSLNTAFPTQGGRAAVLTFLHRKAAAMPKP